jgi:hypothetical protein
MVGELSPGQTRHTPEMHVRVENLETRVAELISVVGQLEGRLDAGHPGSSGAVVRANGAAGQ